MLEEKINLDHVLISIFVNKNITHIDHIIIWSYYIEFF